MADIYQSFFPEDVVEVEQIPIDQVILSNEISYENDFSSPNPTSLIVPNEMVIELPELVLENLGVENLGVENFGVEKEKDDLEQVLEKHEEVIEMAPMREEDSALSIEYVLLENPSVEEKKNVEPETSQSQSESFSSITSEMESSSDEKESSEEPSEFKWAIYLAIAFLSFYTAYNSAQAVLAVLFPGLGVVLLIVVYACYGTVCFVAPMFVSILGTKLR